MADPTMPQDGDPPAPRDRRRDARLVGVGVAAALLVWFALVNLQDVRVRFWVTSTRAPVIVVIAISGLLGAALASLVGRMVRRRRGSGRESGDRGASHLWDRGSGIDG